MKPYADPLTKFVRLRAEIAREREELLVRLREVDEELMSFGVRRTDAFYGPRTRTGRVRNPMSLRNAVLKVLAGGKALTKEEVLDGVYALGYQFATDNPLNSLGVVLYGRNPKFQNEGGRFSLGD